VRRGEASRIELGRGVGRAILIALAGLAAPGCGGDGPANLVRKTIGPDGDIITSHDGVLTIVLLPGALEESVEVEIFPSDEPPRVYGPAYRVRPDIDLAVDAEITYRRVLPSDPNDAAVGAIRVSDYSEGGGNWSELPRLSLDVEDESITATDSELSLYYALLEVDGFPPPTGTESGSATGDDSTGTPGETTMVADGSSGSTSTGELAESSSSSSSDGGAEVSSSSSDGGGETSSTTTDPTVDPDTGSSTDDGGMMMFVCSDGTPMLGELCYAVGGDFAVGTAPSDLVLGDFDGDGELDVVTSNRGSDDATLVLGAGDGTFGAPTAFAVGTSPGAIEVGDFDDDGNLDVVVVNTDDDTVGLLVGGGDGTFAAQATFPVGDAPSDLATGVYGVGAADDLVVVNSGSATIQILTGDPTGMLTASAPFAVLPAAATTIVAGDFNSDALGDAFAFGAGGAFHGWAGNGAGAFGAGLEISGNYGGNLQRAFAADMDGNGTGDVAIVNTATDELMIRGGSGAATFFEVATPAVGADPSDVATADLSGTGLHAAAVTGRASNDVTILRQLPGQLWGVEETLPVGMGPSAVKIGDVTGDGVLDIVVCNETSGTITVIESDP
jgi:hypothetical protein